MIRSLLAVIVESLLTSALLSTPFIYSFLRSFNYSIVDINQSLVDDALVDKDKIGGSNYFWSFPAKKDRLLQLKHEATLQEIELLKEQNAVQSVKLADAKRGREDDGGERAKKLARLAELSKEKQAVTQELETLKENDPQALADLSKTLQLTKDAANRWTDNIFNCKSYLTKKRGMDKKEACKILGITSAFDCTCIFSMWTVIAVIIISTSYRVLDLFSQLTALFSFSRQCFTLLRLASLIVVEHHVYVLQIPRTRFQSSSRSSGLTRTTLLTTESGEEGSTGPMEVLGCHTATVLHISNSIR